MTNPTLLNRLRQVFSPNGKQRSLDQMRWQEADSFRFLTPNTKFDYAREVGDGLLSSVIMGPVQFIMRTAPEAIPMVWRKLEGGEREPIADHPLLTLLNTPTPFYGGVVLWMATYLDWCIAGNVFWIKIRDSVLSVTELWYTPHWLIRVRGTQREFITRYEYNPGGLAQPIFLPAEDVVHFRFGIDPHNVRLGLSPLDSVVREVFTDNEASNFQAALLKNHGVIGLILSPKEASMASADDAKAIKLSLKERTTGDRRGEPMVFTTPTDISEFGFDPSKMNIGFMRNVAEERVTALLGIPSSVVGFGTGMEQTKVGATLEGYVKLAWTGGIIPTQRMMADVIQKQLLPEFEGNPDAFEFGFDTSKVAALQESENERAKRFQGLVQGGIITVAQAQRELGFDPDDAQEIYLRSIAQIEVPLGETLTGSEHGSAHEDEEKSHEPSLLEQTVISDRPVRKPNRMQARLMASLVRQRAGLETAFFRRLKKVFREFAKEAEEAANSVLKATKQVEVALEFEDIAILTERIMEELSLAGVSEAMRKEFEGHYLAALTETTGTVNTISGLAIDIPDEVARRVVAEGGRRLGLMDLTEQTRGRIFRELAEGITAGEGPSVLARRIRNVPAGPWRSVETRARVIARTETLHAQRVSTLEIYGQSDTITDIMVFDARLGPTDAVCEALDGRIVSIEEARQLMVEEHPNGTRSFAPVIGGG